MNIHPKALVETDSIGAGTNVWAFAHILADAKIGANVNVGDHTFIEGGAVVGDNVTIKNQVCVWDGVVIEADCFIGPRVTFTNDCYPRSPRMLSVKQRYSSPENWLEHTKVRRGASIGAAATICPGVELGPYCVVAAGAVVTTNVPAHAIVAGVPAKHLRDACTCGQPLENSFDTSSCKACGETPSMRISKLEALQSSEPQQEVIVNG